jgi:hypothetical protein
MENNGRNLSDVENALIINPVENQEWIKEKEN